MALYFCQNCNRESTKWIGRCPSCDEWNTYVEKIQNKEFNIDTVNKLDKLDELLDYRKAEISADKKARIAKKKAEDEAKRKDQANYSKAVWAGILGALVGGIAGIIGGAVIILILAAIILPIYSWSKYGLGSPKDTSNWAETVQIISVIIGAIIGYIWLFFSTREDKD